MKKRAPGGGRKSGPLGKKESRSVRLTPDVLAYCEAFGFGELEAAVRRSAGFKEWLKGRVVELS